MSSLDRAGRTLRASIVILLCLGLGACFRPLYGPTASGALLQDLLGAIEVAPASTSLGQERIGHELRSELVYMLDGSGLARNKRFVLGLVITESVQTPIVDQRTGRTDTATLVAAVTYVLKDKTTGKVVTEGTARSTANYDRDAQRFASVRAARDAEIRVSRIMAEEIRTRVSAVLSVAP